MTDINVDRYNPGNLPMMEDYLRDQMEQGEHDMLVNLAILKLFVKGIPICKTSVR